jgi:hypothetical protein
VVIVDRVVDQPAGAAWAHEPHAAEQPELVRDRRFADVDERRDVADAQLAGRERIEDANTRRITQHAESFREPFDRACREKLLTASRRSSLVEMVGDARNVFSAGGSRGNWRHMNI